MTFKQPTKSHIVFNLDSSRS